MTKNVFIAKVQSYSPALCEAAVEELFAQLPCTRKIGPDTKILLKPNLLAKAVPEKSVTTHPEVLRAVIRACKRRGAPAEHIVVADSAGGVYNPGQMRTLYQMSGLAEVCREEGVLAYTACESVVVPAAGGKVVSEFELIRPVVEADFIIDLPKLKTHVMTGLTAATKNLFGTIPGLKKAEWHMRFPDRERFGEMLIDLLQTVRPQMAVLDGIVGMEGDGPSGGSPRPLGLLMAAEDLPQLDLACCELIGLDAMQVPYLSAAARRGLCAEAFDHACLAGDAAAFTSVLPTGWLLPSSFREGGVASTDFAEKVPAPLTPLVRALEKRMAPHPVVDAKLCIGCGKCAEICPQQTIEMKNHKSRILPKDCIRCFCCHEMCPVKAIEVHQLRLFRL